MVDLHGKDKGNISLPVKLQPLEDEEEQKNQPTIINMQRAFYSIRIADIENRINRLEDRNDELLEEITTVDELSYQADTKTAEEIANLYKQVCAQTDRVENLKNQIDAIEKSRIQDKQIHEDKVVLFNQRYKETKVTYVSQMKVLNAEINTLEDFKKVQTDLEEKFKANDELMVMNEEKVKDVLKTISRKFEFDKEILKSEMYIHLLDLAAKFQTQTNRYISLPNQRLMRENIMLQNELMQMSKSISIRTKIETDFKNSNVKHRKIIVEQLLDTKRNIVTAKVQDSVLKQLKKKYGKLKELVSLIKVPDSTMERKCLMSIESAQQAGYEVTFLLSKLQTLLHKVRTKIGNAKYVHKRLECRIKAVVETLYDLKFTITRILKGSTKMTELSYTELLLLLQHILIKGRSKFRCSIIESIETIPRDTRFHAEDLENIPDDIEISTESEEKEPSYIAVLDTIQSRKYPEKSIGSSVFEEESETLFEDIILSDTHLELEDYELDKDGEEYSENESLFNINEE